MKLLGYLIIGFFLLFCIGSFVAPFAAMVWFVATNSLEDIVKGVLILYVVSIPLCWFLDAKRRAENS